MADKESSQSGESSTWKWVVGAGAAVVAVVGFALAYNSARNEYEEEKKQAIARKTKKKGTATATVTAPAAAVATVAAPVAEEAPKQSRAPPAPSPTAAKKVEEVKQQSVAKKKILPAEKPSALEDEKIKMILASLESMERTAKVQPSDRTKVLPFVRSDEALALSKRARLLLAQVGRVAVSFVWVMC